MAEAERSDCTELPTAAGKNWRRDGAERRQHFFDSGFFGPSPDKQPLLSLALCSPVTPPQLHMHTHKKQEARNLMNIQSPKHT